MKRILFIFCLAAFFVPLISQTVQPKISFEKESSRIREIQRGRWQSDLQVRICKYWGSGPDHSKCFSLLRMYCTSLDP